MDSNTLEVLFILSFTGAIILFIGLPCLVIHLKRQALINRIKRRLETLEAKQAASKELLLDLRYEKLTSKDAVDLRMCEYKLDFETNKVATRDEVIKELKSLIKKPSTRPWR